MRKLSLALITVFSMTLFLCATAFAAYEKGENIETTPWQINSLVINKVEYNPSRINLEKHKKDPKMGPQLLTAEDLQNIALEVAKTDKLPFVVEVAPAEADAYATVTVANDSRIAMFVDVYNMKDHKWLYTYQIVSGGTTMDTPENYKMMFHKFFRSLNLQMEANAKELKSKK